MKASRSYLMVVALSLGACAAVMVVALGGHFRSLERGGAAQSSEKRTNDTLQFFHSQLKAADGPEMARAQLKAFENLFGHGPDSEAVDRIKKAYGPVVAAFAGQPKEAESRFLIVKKRELMESLVNAYRKELPAGSIRLRAAYLNILFDTQNSLLNDGEQLEEVFLRRTKERMAALRGMAGEGDAALQARVANIDGIVAGFEKGLEQRVKWLEQRTEALARAEKALPKLARDLRGSRDDELDNQRRGFLYTAVAAALVFLFSLIGIYANHKVMRLRFESRIDTFLRFLQAFGRERGDPALDREFRDLAEEQDWGPLMAGGLEAEADFISKHQTLIAVPRSMGCGYVVFDKNRVARHWNDRAATLLGLREGTETTLAEVANAGNMNPREGDSVSVADMIATAFPSPKEDVFELLLKVGEEWVPVEILADPVKTGPLAGGKVFLFREIRSEAARVDRAVAMHLSSVRDRVHKITHGYPVAEFVASSHPEVNAAHEDLGLMKRKVDEREALWASEAGALTDQVVRQKEILTRLGDEIRLLREAHGQVQELVTTVHGGEEHWHDEVCVLDRELARWRTQRERLESDLTSYGQVLDRARKYESEVRVSANGLTSFLEGFESVVAELKRFSEEAKVQAVNLSFVKDPGYWEFASRARAYANEITRFVEQTASLAGRVRQFVDRHPGNSLAPHLESLPPHAESVRSLKEEEERFAGFLARWKESGGALVKDGEEALDILREAEKKGAVCTQLGDTILLINEQAQDNLGRWI